MVVWLMGNISGYNQKDSFFKELIGNCKLKNAFFKDKTCLTPSRSGYFRLYLSVSQWKLVLASIKLRQ
jgi:hypothetical protein